MKKTKKLKLALMLLPMAALAFTSCSDNTDDATTTSSSADVKWDIDEYMDTSVKPGDDFARYCWGKWYDNAGEPDDYGLGTLTEASVATSKKVAKLDNKEWKLLLSDVEKLKELALDYSFDYDADEELSNLAKKLCAQLDNPDALEVAKLLGEFYASGRNCMIQRGFSCWGEKNFFYVDWQNTNYVSDILVSTAMVDESELPEWYRTLGVQDYAAKCDSFMMKPNFEPDKDAVIQKMKYSEEQIAQAFCQSFGISTDQMLNCGQLAKLILESRTKVLQCMICSVITDLGLVDYQHFYALQKYWVILKTERFLSMMFSRNQLLDYPQSKEYCDAYCTAEHRQKVYDLMEDLRTNFAQRIDNLEWMSNTTKKAAKEKLAAIKCFASYPDKWYEAGIPHLEGKSMYYDMQALRQARINLQKELLSVNPREDYLNVLFASRYSASTPNCFYNPLVNSVIILAPLMSEPIYSLSDPDAKLYAAGAIIGHELTHAFDTDGSKYGPKGESENWWTVSDKQDFDSRTQLLVDCYNHLPAYQDCAATAFTDGTKTLGENIADLGGLELALQAYTSKLEQQGVQGEELVKAQKRFFQAYANLWRTKNTPADNAEQLTTDSHANSYTRILGSTMNCNRWYELYDVKWGDKYYLRPEKRTHIW